MLIENPEFIEKLCLWTFSASGDGMHVEITRADKDGKEIDTKTIVTFREDEERGKQVVLHASGNKNDLVIPLSEFKRAIEFAEREVHCESFYDTKSDNL